MGYKIMYRGNDSGRRENWNRKIYTTKAAAIKVKNKAIAQYKGNRYVKDVKDKNFKIVSTGSNRRTGGFPGMGAFRMPRF